ncbi:hypothetical protein GGI03_000954 [Coemansia sp. RSA 2337]|nr:hypothetical protein GGI08_002242 [Coemansia sp. S2]KAJ2105063.1 hypothetical protein GGI16_002512 [Coemansia sp. S142-1]KAJ2351744.1 hypothetical protein GGH92_001663 [Coemansia sp. RSA 2673]KAJ2468502.1 hypothetical protein GGI03_000954 [Coemansia sp. RSA 2337]
MLQDDIDFSVETAEEKYITFKLRINLKDGALFMEIDITANSNEHVEALPGLVYEQYMLEPELDMGSIELIKKKGSCLLAPGETFECNLVSNGSILQVTLSGHETVEDPINQEPLAYLANEVDNAYGSMDEKEEDRVSVESIDIEQENGKDESGYNSGERYPTMDIYDPCAHFEIDNDY